MKKIKKIFILSLIILLIFTFNYPCLATTKKSQYNNSKYSKVYSASNLKSGINYANHNTSYLQSLIDSVPIKSTIYIPSGTYYFAPATANPRKTEEYVIKCRSNITIQGAGKSTILKPYGTSSLPSGGIDMFYFNDYHDYNKATYLENVTFKNFVIDSVNAHSQSYNSSGKGFMINLYKNCHWSNITVKNTDGTGFGMDCPINSTITNCTAIDCGKAAKSTSVGASGFGIGTGYSENESITINNCTAKGNKKYGFFFEHQTRFETNNNNNNKYTASKSQGFVVSNCMASGNMYDFGGARANDVTYKNCVSNKSYTNNDVTHMSPFNFENISVRVRLINCKSSHKFTDVSNKSAYYYDAIYWGINNAITNGVSTTKFAPNKGISKLQALIFIWRMAGMPGNVAYYTGSAFQKQFENLYSNISGNYSNIEVIKWAKESNIIDSTSSTFYNTSNITRADFIMLLWKYAGSPKVNTTNNFKDVDNNSEYINAVNWAVNQEILSGTSATTFSPNKVCTRAEAITILYRYDNKY